MLPWVLACAAGARFDCTERLSYGDKASFRMSKQPAAPLMFYAAANPARGAELSMPARSGSPPGGGWWVEEGWGSGAGSGPGSAAGVRLVSVWDVQKTRVTQKDQGIYSVRQRDGTQIYKTHLCVQGKEESRTVNASQDVVITFSHSVDDFLLTFLPREQPHSSAGKVVELVREGRWVSGAREGSVAPAGEGLTLRSVREADSGTYQASDRHGNLFHTLELTVYSPLDSLSSLFFGKRVFAVSSAILLVCCLRKCCCTCNQHKRPPEPLPVYKHSGEEESNQRPPVTSDHTQYGVSPPVTIHVWPPSEDEATSSYPENSPAAPVENNGFTPPPCVTVGAPLFTQGPAVEDDGPRYPTPTGPAPTFQLEDVLSSDTPTYDTYTSDKLNFL